MKNNKIKLPYPVKDKRYENASLSKVMDLSSDQAKNLDAWVKNPKHFLFIHADFGVGKTYIAAAIANWRYEKNLHTYYFNEHDIFVDLHALEQDGYKASYKLSDISENEFVIWDDFGSTITNGKNDFKDNDKKNLMFQFIDDRYNSMLPTVITTNFTGIELGAMINKRISSRLLAKENLIIEIFGEEKRQQGF